MRQRLPNSWSTRLFLVIFVTACAGPAASQNAAGPAPPAPIGTRLTDFLDLNPLQVFELLGPPVIFLDEPGMSAWRYDDGGGCLLNMYFYEPQSDSGVFRVGRAEVLPEGTPKEEELACISRLLARAAP